ncbi:MAG: OmpA family protein [Rhodobacteraceae bacterium]|nr:OmpA family protein [Paracoccaceae bacterium]
MKALAVILALIAAPLAAQEAYRLPLPATARIALEVAKPGETYALPIGPYAGFLPVEDMRGTRTTRVWKVAQAQALTTQQMLQPLVDRLDAAGFTPLLLCQSSECGGYDFRFATDVIPAPEMQVDLANFRFYSARRGDEAISLLVSRLSATGFIQMIHIAPVGIDAPKAANRAEAPPAKKPAEALTPPTEPRSIEEALRVNGRAVLSDLQFESGAASLGDKTYPSLAALAAHLAANPGDRIAVVGHTDATGSLDGNIALSERRAAAALERLVSAHSVPRTQLEARGIGYLAPRAPNTTAEGREANRRVEAVLLPKK